MVRGEEFGKCYLYGKEKSGFLWKPHIQKFDEGNLNRSERRWNPSQSIPSEQKAHRHRNHFLGFDCALGRLRDLGDHGARSAEPTGGCHGRLLLMTSQLVHPTTNIRQPSVNLGVTSRVIASSFYTIPNFLTMLVFTTVSPTHLIYLPTLLYLVVFLY